MTKGEIIWEAKKFGADVHHGPTSRDLVVGVPAEMELVMFWGEELVEFVKFIRLCERNACMAAIQSLPEPAP